MMRKGAGPNPEIRGARSAVREGRGPQWVDAVYLLCHTGEATAVYREGVRGWAGPRSLPSFRVRKA